MGSDARNGVHRPQHRPGGQGVRLVLPAHHRRRRLPARAPAHVRPHCDDPSPGPDRRCAGHGQAGVHLRRRHPPGHRPARPGLDGLLRQLVHDRAPARLPPRLAPAPRGEGGRQLRPGDRLGGGVPRLLGAAGWRAQRPGGGGGIAGFVVVALALSTAIWWFTAWLMLKGQVRLRVLLPSGLITAIAISAYGLSATLWMPNNVASNNHQYGIFGVALALVAWFSGAAICIVVGACAGPVLAEDPGPIGRLVRGGAASPLVEGALPPLPPPVRLLHLADAFSPSDDDDIPQEPERPAKPSPVEQNTDE